MKDTASQRAELLNVYMVLAAEYWARVDRTCSGAVADLYEDPARMTLGTLDVVGKDAIRDFFTQRNEREQDRTTRHFMSSVRIEPIDDAHFVAHSTVMVCAGIGSLPLLAGPPITIADFEDQCVYRAGTGYLFSTRRAHIVFTGPGAASFSKAPNSSS
jgi:hypothetical protein